MTAPAEVASEPADVDLPLHELLRPAGRPNPHLEAALAKWRRQVDEDPDKTISAFASSVR